MTKKTIALFCGSSDAVDEKYKILARETGEIIAQAEFDLVYGGARIGLMGAAADAALSQGARVTGYIPHFLKNLEVAHTGLSQLHLTETMHERQMGMAEMADGFLILPGGLGTLAEFFEIITWRQMKLHDKPVGVLNAYGYWDGLLEFLDHAQTERFNRKEDQELFMLLAGTGDLKKYLTGLKN